MLTSSQPYIANPSYRFKQCMFNRDFNSNLVAVCTFSVLDSNNREVDTVQFRVAPADWNTFWNAFNSGTFLYQTLNTVKNLGLTIADGSQDGDFINNPPVVAQQEVII